MMTSSSSPNIFRYASSELSQDAFICWLISWAKPGFSEEDAALHKTALELIEALFEKHGHSYDTPPGSVEVRQQYNDMDVVVVLDGEIALLIEDKVHASAHSGQLDRYRSTLVDEFGKENVFPIYFKTGDQSDFQHARENGYEPFLRDGFLEVLDSGLSRGLNNDVFRNYRRHLLEMKRKVESFEGTPADEWPQAAWKGFFQLLQTRLGHGSWKYVPLGDFMGFWWHSFSSNGCRQYLQLEEKKLCFKIAVDEESNQKPLREKWHERVIDASRGESLQVEKPNRFGKGEHMTVAVFPKDYRATDKEGLIDIEKTLSRLRQAENVLSLAVEEENRST